MTVVGGGHWRAFFLFGGLLCLCQLLCCNMMRDCVFWRTLLGLSSVIGLHGFSGNLGVVAAALASILCAYRCYNVCVPGNINNYYLSEPERYRNPAVKWAECDPRTFLLLATRREEKD